MFQFIALFPARVAVYKKEPRVTESNMFYSDMVSNWCYDSQLTVISDDWIACLEKLLQLLITKIAVVI